MVFRGNTDEFPGNVQASLAAVGSLTMEGIVVLESLHAANEQIKQHLPKLKKYSSTLNIKVPTDCQAILRHIFIMWQSKIHKFNYSPFVVPYSPCWNTSLWNL